MVTRRSKRTLKEDLEVVTYNASSEQGSHLVEDFATPGGPFLAVGEEVDLEIASSFLWHHFLIAFLSQSLCLSGIEILETVH